MVELLSLMTGIDIPIPSCQLILHQPTLKEIAYLGESKYFIGAQCLNISKTMATSQDETVLENITNFQIFMTIMSSPETRDKKDITLQVLQLLFPSYKATITPRSLLFFNSQTKENIIIDEQNFDDLQEVVKEVFCLTNNSMSQQNYNPADSKAKEIAEKLMRGRERIAKEKNGNRSTSLIAQYISSLSVGLNSFNLSDLMNLTLFQLYDLIERYGLYINWDLDIRTRLAGGKPDSQPDNWMKNIH